VARSLWRVFRLGLLALLLLTVPGPVAVLTAGLPSPAGSRSPWERAGVRGAGASAYGLPLPLGEDWGEGRQAPAKDVEGDPAFLPEVWAGFDGLTKAGRWLTVRAVVNNDGPPLDGQLRLTTRAGGEAAIYTQRVELATRARKMLVFQVPGPTSPGELKLALRVGDLDLTTRDLPLRTLGPTDFLVGVMSDDGVVPSGLGAVRRGGNPVAVARLTPADLPTDPLALQTLDALVVRQASSDRLTTEQRRALRTWVEQGGQLIVAGGPGWRRSIEGLDDLLPVEGLWTRQVKHLRAFTRYAGVAPPDGDVLVALGSPVEGARVLLSQESIPLLVERWLGLGRVTFVGADPALEPFRSWPASESLWQRILVGGRPGLPALDVTSIGGSPLRSALGEMLDLGLPSPNWVIAFLLGYVAVAGPGQYLVLRRLDRREWAWIGFPLLALGAAGLLLGGAAWLRGPDVRLAALSIVRVSEDTGTAPLDTYVGLVAPTRGSYDLTLPDGLVPRPLADFGTGGAAAPMTIEPGVGSAPTALPDLRLEGRVLRGLQLRSLVTTPTPIGSDLKATNGRLEGTIRNAGPDRLEDVILIAAGEAIGLGDLAPGDSRPVSISLPTSRAAGAWQNGPPPWAVPGARVGAGGDRRRALIAQLVQPSRGSDGETNGGVSVLAWLPATPPRVTLGAGTVAGAARRLLEQALPVEYGDEQVAIPPGLLGRAILDGAALGRGGPSSFVARGPIVFQFDLPPALELARIDRLSVHLAIPGRPAGAPATLPVMTPPSATGAVAPRVSLYRWADRTWVDVPLSGTGVANLSFGASFVDGGAIRARIEPQGSEIQVDQLDLSLEGVRE
jgi:hypothetical protein